MRLYSIRPQRKLGDSDGHTPLRLRLAAAVEAGLVHLVVVVPVPVGVALFVLVVGIAAGIAVRFQLLQHLLELLFAFWLAKRGDLFEDGMACQCCGP